MKSASPAPYPQWAMSAHLFQLFNAVAFQIMMSAPIILFAKSLGASSTVLGVIASFTPLMTVMQLPAAGYLSRYSYRQFVLGGWGARTIFIFLVAAIPLLGGFLSARSRMGLLLFALFSFNLLRGISSAGWMPWIAALVPPEVRGRFLAVDQTFMYLGSLAALVSSALLMHGNVEDWKYSLVFAVSAAGGTASLFFIRRIPDAPTGESFARSAQEVPWSAMLRYRPFRRLIEFNLLFMAVTGSLGVFTIEYLREFPKFEADVILLLSGVSFIGPLLTLRVTGSILDRFGSKPMLALSLGMFLAVIAGWFFVATGAIPARIPVVLALNFLTGMAGATFGVANLRITMATMPEMGRNHFFALFTAVTNLGLGAAPVVWGLILDTLGSYERVTGSLSWKRHSIYFAALFLLTMLSFLLVRRLEDEE